VRKLVVLAAVLLTAVPGSAATTRILAPMDWWPVWSPGGEHVAFTRVYANHMELWTYNTRTQGTVRVATGSGQLGPTWSPDGRRLAYSSGGVIRTVAPDGSAKQRLHTPGRSYAPAWRPTGDEFAYLTTQGATNTDLWEGARLWARNVVGSPAWSPDGTELAFQRDDGIYVTSGPGSERRVVSIANPGPPVWSHDGSRIAYTAQQALWTIAAGGGTPVNAAPQPSAWPSIGTPSWSFDDKRIVFSWARGVWVTVGQGGYAEDPHERVFGAGAAFAPASYFVAYSASRPACPGHVGIHRRGVSGTSPTLTGSCLVTGTARADVIEGTPLWGDVILGLAGNDQIHANDGHTDRVECGPGRDTVWADRTDRLTGCEIVHR
jgi:hypothetical protein